MTAAIRGAVLYSNAYITAVAGAMTYRSFLLQDRVPDLRVVSLAAACTLAAYSLHSLDSDEMGREDRNAWNRRHRTWLWGCLVTSGLAAIGWVITIDGILPLLAPAMLLTAYYLIPRLSMLGVRSIRLRGKTPVLALAWTYTTYLLPLLHAGARLTYPMLVSGLILEFSMVYLVCLFFDHRDARKEEYHAWLINPVKHLSSMLWLSGISFAAAGTWGYAVGLPPAWLAVKACLMAGLLSTSTVSLRSDSDAWFNLVLDGCLGADILFLIL
jgi:hypothetical protein